MKQCLLNTNFLKILRKKSTLIVMVASLLVTAILFGLPILRYQTYNQEGVITGLAGIEYEKEQAENYSVPLTDDISLKQSRKYSSFLKILIMWDMTVMNSFWLTAHIGTVSPHGNVC